MKCQWISTEVSTRKIVSCGFCRSCFGSPGPFRPEFPRHVLAKVVFAVIRVISAVFLKAHGRLAWGGLTISTRMCWLVDSTIALLTTVLHYPFSNMYSYLNSSLVYIYVYNLNGNMWRRECPKLFFSMEGGIPHRDTPGTFLFINLIRNISNSFQIMQFHSK